MDMTQPVLSIVMTDCMTCSRMLAAARDFPRRTQSIDSQRMNNQTIEMRLRRMTYAVEALRIAADVAECLRAIFCNGVKPAAEPRIVALSVIMHIRPLSLICSVNTARLHAYISALADVRVKFLGMGEDELANICDVLSQMLVETYNRNHPEWCGMAPGCEFLMDLHQPSTPHAPQHPAPNATIITAGDHATPTTAVLPNGESFEVPSLFDGQDISIALSQDDAAILGDEL